MVIVGVFAVLTAALSSVVTLFPCIGTVFRANKCAAEVSKAQINLLSSILATLSTFSIAIAKD